MISRAKGHLPGGYEPSNGPSKRSTAAALPWEAPYSATSGLSTGTGFGTSNLRSGSNFGTSDGLLTTDSGFGSFGSRTGSGFGSSSGGYTPTYHSDSNHGYVDRLPALGEYNYRPNETNRSSSGYGSDMRPYTSSGHSGLGDDGWLHNGTAHPSSSLGVRGSTGSSSIPSKAESSVSHYEKPSKLLRESNNDLGDISWLESRTSLKTGSATSHYQPPSELLRASKNDLGDLSWIESTASSKTESQASHYQLPEELLRESNNDLGDMAWLEPATSSLTTDYKSDKPTGMIDGADWLKKARDSLSPPPTTNPAYYESMESSTRVRLSNAIGNLTPPRTPKSQRKPTPSWLSDTQTSDNANLNIVQRKPAPLSESTRPTWLQDGSEQEQCPARQNEYRYDDDDDLSLAESLTDVMNNLREQQQESNRGSGRMASVLANIRLDSKYADDIEYIPEEEYAIDDGSPRGKNMAEESSHILSEARTTVFTGTQLDNRYAAVREYNVHDMNERHQREIRMEEESARILSEARTTVYTGSPPDIRYAIMREYNAADMDEHHHCEMKLEEESARILSEARTTVYTESPPDIRYATMREYNAPDEHRQREMRMEEESARILSEARTTVYADTQRDQIDYPEVKKPTINISASRFARYDSVSVKHPDDDNDLESLDAKLAMLAEKNAKMREASSETMAELQEKLQATQAIDVRADSNPETTTSDEEFWGPSEPATKIKSKEPTIANYNQVAARSETTIERELEMNDTPNMYAQRRIHVVFDNVQVSLSNGDNTEDEKNEEPCSTFKEIDEKSFTDGESEETDDDQTFEEVRDIYKSREENDREYVAVSGSQPYGEKPFSVIKKIGHPSLSAVKHRDSNHVVQSPAKTRPSRKLAKYLAKGALSSESSDDDEDEQGDANNYHPAVKMSAPVKLNDTGTHKEETMYAPNLVCKPNMTNVKLPSSAKPTVDVNTYSKESLNSSDSDSESSLKEVQATSHPKVIQNELTATDPMMIQKLIRKLVQREFNAHEATRKSNSTSESVKCGHAGNDKTRIDYGDEFRSEMKKHLEELKILRKSQKLNGEELRELYEKHCAKYIARADKQLEQIIEDLKREKVNYEILNKTTIKLNQALKQKLQSVRTEQKREEKHINNGILKRKRSDVNKHEEMKTKREWKREYFIKPMDEMANLVDNHVSKNKHTCKSKRLAGYCVSYQGGGPEVEGGRRPRKMGKRKGGADKAAAQEEIKGSRTGGTKADVRKEKKTSCGLVDLFKSFFKKK